MLDNQFTQLMLRNLHALHALKGLTLRRRGQLVTYATSISNADAKAGMRLAADWARRFFETSPAQSPAPGAAPGAAPGNAVPGNTTPAGPGSTPPGGAASGSGAAVPGAAPNGRAAPNASSPRR
jgi:hypothetical protein